MSDNRSEALNDITTTVPPNQRPSSDPLVSESLLSDSVLPGIVLKNLDSSTIALTGRHLIEASAGTGKTYNITRIYLRLLLERELRVEQILLMTFTKDATQELRGRIDSFIRSALHNWSTLCLNDTYFQAIDARVCQDKRKFLLKRALLFLDEAAIFTIHGFCQRVLNQHAFSSGLPFNVNMAADTKEIILQACQDFYRQLAQQKPSDFLLLSEFWSTPDSFLSSFNKAIGHTSELALVSEASIAREFIARAKKAQQDLESHAALLEEALIVVKKGADQAKRREELNALHAWLNLIIACDVEQSIDPLSHLAKMPDAFIDGRRYGRSGFKIELQGAFEQVNKLKDQSKSIGGKLNKARAYQRVKQGIYTIRQQVTVNKKRLNMLDFDDLINTLATSLAAQTEPEQQSHFHLNLNPDELKQTVNKPKSSLGQTLLAQYPVALVDEFQDTDPKQFSILQAIYYGEQAKKAGAGLFLIGDPKQAIYGFRGGDIFAYLNARSGCEYHWLMDTNWRSSPEMIAGYNEIFTDKVIADENGEPKSTAVFGYGIPYLPVLAGKKTEVNKPVGPTGNDQALQFIHFSESTEQNIDKVNQGSRTDMASWCAHEIGLLLGSNRAKPKDIALLVRDGSEARDIKKALFSAGLDSVFLSDRANLFDSIQAQQLLKVFKGILFLENERLFIAALASGLLGFTREKLIQLQQDEQAYQTLKFAFVDCRHQWQRQGFITMAINLMHQHFVVVNEDKDRCLTNLLHLFEILQAASQRHQQPQALLHWFEQECTLENPETEAELRLESDGDLIRIITQHGAKGLEYPYVFIPFATRHKDPLKFGTKSVSYIEYHNDQGELTLSLDGDNTARKAMSDESYAESIRLLYVAITRAEQRCYVLTTCFDKYHLSPLGKALQWQDDTNIYLNIEQLVAKSPHAISLSQVTFEQQYQPNQEQPLDKSSHHVNDSSVIEKPQVAKFNGHIERDWWLSSFSALTRNIRHGGISAPDRDSALSSVAASSVTELSVTSTIRFNLIKGAHTGILLHDILETSDFGALNWAESMQRPLAHYGELMGQEGHSFTEENLISWLNDVIAAPFICQRKTDEKASLSMLPLNKTLRESEFYFPMNSGTNHGLAKLITDHRNKVSVGVHWEQSKIAANLPSYKNLFGMMHGFIDLVFEFEGKYFVCDYKSSHLGDQFSDYNQVALKANMESNYYDLQYLIYSLALHRYLQASLPNYQPSEHFGGSYYLYLRGMTADPEHLGAGIYYRHIDESELEALDKLFKGTELVGDKKFTLAAET